MPTAVVPNSSYQRWKCFCQSWEVLLPALGSAPSNAAKSFASFWVALPSAHAELASSCAMNALWIK